MSDRRCGGGGGFLIRLPESIINEILVKLELDTLCSVACVCKTLRFSVSQTLSSFSSLDVSAFSPDVDTLSHIFHSFRDPNSVTVDCLHLDDSTVTQFLGPHLQQLSLFKCSSLSSRLLASIGQSCPNLRVLVLEMAGRDTPKIFKWNLVQLLEGCSYLESLCIKIRGTELDANGFASIGLLLPKTVKVLKLQPMLNFNAINFIHVVRDNRNFIETLTNFSIPFCQGSPISALQSLSLVLNVISDGLITSIVNSLPLLVELDLEDRPCTEPLLPHDLTNNGLQALGSCQHLTSLSLIRSRHIHPTSFKRTNDMGMFLLSEGCRGLESVRLGGFSKISDAGFAAILHSCHNLKKFEVRNASLLSDLAFHDIVGAPCSLVEVRILSCKLITSEFARGLASSNKLELLDLYGCRSIADASLYSVLCLSTLTTLNLGGADVTDSGMDVLGRGKSPIVRLCLRGCKRVTDKGIALLLNGEGGIKKTLSSLDVGYMPGMSDRAIYTISSVGQAIIELCIRYCFFVTDVSVKTLASERRLEGGSKLIRRLDLCNCTGLSVESLGLLKKPFFRGLQWLGVGSTRMTSKGDSVFKEIHEEKPWLTVCLDGCEMGCHDGWQFHKSDKC